VITTLADRLAVLVFAASSIADHFDELGCVRVEKWERHYIALDESQVVRAERPEDQCRAVMQRIASFDGRYAAQQITIGLGDAELSPGLQRAARWAGLFAHDPSGTGLDRSAPARFLEAASDWLSRHRFAELATLLRHPDVEAAVKCNVGDRAAVEDWLSLLDVYFSCHLHAKVTGTWLGDTEQQKNLKNVHDAVQRLLAPLEGPPRERPIGQWCDSIIQVLGALYAGVTQDDVAHASALEACHRIAGELEQYRSCPWSLQPDVDASTALRLIATQLAAAAIPSNTQRDQIDMLGWLEVPLCLTLRTLAQRR
jgi:hypothetical protein